MTEKNKKNWIRLTSTFTYIAFLSACGAGTDTNTTESDTPQIGPVVEAPTIPIPSIPTAPAPAPAPVPVPGPVPGPVPVPVPVPESESESAGSGSEQTETVTEEVEAAPPPAEPIPEQPAEPLPVEPDVEPVPLPVPPTNVSCKAAAVDVQQSSLSLINTARATARSCGDTFFDAAPPLTWSDKLATAARLHSEDMAQNNFFSHTGSDGLSVSQRVDEQQYNWRSIGENIAAGQPTTEAAIDAWLESPGHCKNLMNPTFTELAVECVEDNGSQYRQYWTNVLGTRF